MCPAVSAVSGTTRDAVDTEVVDAEGNKFNLIDTAGIRKRSAVTDSADGAEPLSVHRAIQAVRRAQVGISATHSFAHQFRKAVAI